MCRARTCNHIEAPRDIAKDEEIVPKLRGVRCEDGRQVRIPNVLTHVGRAPPVPPDLCAVARLMPIAGGGGAHGQEAYKGRAGGHGAAKPMIYMPTQEGRAHK